MTHVSPAKEFIWVPPAFGGNEGGYTFLKRVLQTAINTAQPVTFGDGTRSFRYSYGADQNVFFDGVVQLDSLPASGIVAHEMDKNMGKYNVPLGIIELCREKKIKPSALGIAARAFLDLVK